MPGRIGDLSTPWVCPPSLVKVFAKRRARDEIREAKRRAAEQERELSDRAFYEAVSRAADHRKDE